MSEELVWAVNDLNSSLNDVEKSLERQNDRLEDIIDAIKTSPDRAVAADCAVSLQRKDLHALMAAILLQGMIARFSSDQNQVEEMLETSLRLSDLLLQGIAKGCLKAKQTAPGDDLPF